MVRDAESVIGRSGQRMYRANGVMVLGRKPDAAETIESRIQIGRRLRSLRGAICQTDRCRETANMPGLTEVSARFGIPSRTWLNYENGKAVPGDLVLRIIVETRVSPQWLLTGDGEMFAAPLAESCRSILSRARDVCDAAIAELDRAAETVTDGG